MNERPVLCKACPPSEWLKCYVIAQRPKEDRKALRPCEMDKAKENKPDKPQQNEQAKT